MLFEDTSIAYNQPQEVFSYNGPMSHTIISELGDFIKVWLSDDEKSSKKVFAILIELLQNASYYSKSSITVHENQEHGVGRFILSHDQDFFYMECGNLVSTSTASKLDQAIEHINSLDHQALRKYKREQRDKPREEESKGAGIGLIQVALLSSNPLQASFTPKGNEYFFYSNTIRINKQKANTLEKI